MGKFNVYAHGTFWGTWEAETTEQAIQLAADEVGTVDVGTDKASTEGMTAIPAADDKIGKSDMTITFTSDLGTELTAPSQEALDSAWDWYNDPRNTKADMIDFCLEHGVDLHDPTDPRKKTLVADWAEIAVATYANKSSS